MTSPDLYGALGVPKDADKAAIRKAYRHKAKDTHPDGGGDERKFALVKLAHDVLSDEARRAKYDSTGDASESSPDNLQSDILQIVCMLLDTAIGNCDTSRVNPLQYPLAGEMAALARKEIAALDKQRSGLLDVQKNARKLLGRFKLKKSAKTKDNFLERILTARVASFDNHIRQVDDKKTRFEAALEIVLSYDFTADAPEPQVVHIMNAFSTSTSTSR